MHHSSGSLLDVALMKKWREARLEVKMLKALDAVLRGRCNGFCTWKEVSKRVGFAAVSKTMAGVGHLKRICEDAFRVADTVQETFPSDMLASSGC